MWSLNFNVKSLRGLCSSNYTPVNKFLIKTLKNVNLNCTPIQAMLSQFFQRVAKVSYKSTCSFKINLDDNPAYQQQIYQEKKCHLFLHEDNVALSKECSLTSSENFPASPVFSQTPPHSTDASPKLRMGVQLTNLW